jgi:O-antigen/teichoic acid export membrane protein
LLADGRKILTVATGSVSQVALAAAAALLTTIYLPVDDRGRYVLLITVLAVSAPLAGLGSNVGLRRERPRHGDPGALDSAYVRLTLTASLLHGLLAPLIVWAVTGKQIPRDAAEAGAVIALGVTYVLSLQFVEFWYARQAFRIGAVYACLHVVAAVAGAGWAAVSSSIVQVLWVHAATSIVVQIVQTTHLSRVRVAASDAGLPRTPMATGLIRSGGSSLLMTAGMSLTFRLDQLILGAVSGAQSVAVYALARSFAELPRFIPVAFGQIANGHAAQTTRRLALRPYLLPGALLTLLAAAGACAVGIIFMTNVDPAYRDAVPPLLILLVAEMALIPFSIVLRIILGGGLVQLSAWVGILGIVLSGTLYSIFIPKFSIIGAAGASVVVYASVSAICLLIHARQKDTGL